MVSDILRLSMERNETNMFILHKNIYIFFFNVSENNRVHSEKGILIKTTKDFC